MQGVAPYVFIYKYEHIFVYFGVIVSLSKILRQTVGSQHVSMCNTKYNCDINVP